MVVSKKRRRPPPDDQGRNQKFLDWIRAQPCCLERHGRHTCHGRIEPGHLRSRGAFGPDADNVVPMCRNLRAVWDNMPREAFEAHVNLRVGWMAKSYLRRYQATSS